MLRTGTDPGPVSRLVPPGAHGKLFSGGRLGKAGVWAGSLPRCHVPRRALAWPVRTGASECGSDLTKARRFRFSKVTLGRDPGYGPSNEDGRAKPSLCLAHGPALHKLSPTPSSFLGQERISVAGGGGVSAVFQDGSGDSTGP